MVWPTTQLNKVCVDDLIASFACKVVLAPIKLHCFDWIGATFLASVAYSPLGSGIAGRAVWEAVVVEELGLQEGLPAGLASEAVLVPLVIECVDEEIHYGLAAGLAHDALLLHVVRHAKQPSAAIDVEDALDKVLAANAAVEATRVDVLDTWAVGVVESEATAVPKLAIALLAWKTAFKRSAINVNSINRDARIFLIDGCAKITGWLRANQPWSWTRSRVDWCRRRSSIQIRLCRI